MSERLKTHSPIEDAMLDAFMSIGDDRVRFSRAKSLDTFVRTLATDWESKRVFVASQVVIGAYRVDFLLGVSRGVSPKLLAVECDGQKYHRSNYDQLERDGERDSVLVIRGVPTMRLSGTQIIRDQWRCARRMLDMIAPRPESGGFEVVHFAVPAALTPRDERWNEWAPTTGKTT